MFSKILIIGLLFLSACSSTALIQTNNKLPNLPKKQTITLFQLKNYTDTPRAGMRAANLLEGILLAHRYNLKTDINSNIASLKEMQQKALQDKSEYFITGGISEWRYKTGIDGEPAVSIQITLYKTQDLHVIWSATGSQNDWGNASIGNTAQKLLEQMLTD